MSKGRILIAESDPGTLADIQAGVNSAGFTAGIARDLRHVYEQCLECHYDIIIVSNNLISHSGPSFFEKISAFPKTPSVIILNDLAGDNGVSGNSGFVELQKPVSKSELKIVLQLVINNRRLAEENEELRKREGVMDDLFFLPAGSRTGEELVTDILRLSVGREPVLLTGEQGTCKEALARIIHSKRLGNSGPFISVSCCRFTEDRLVTELFGACMKNNGKHASTAVKGKIGMADGGAVFIDDIDSAPPSVQIRLIHLISEHGYEIPGTNEWTPADIKVILGAVSANTLRRDLLSRIETGIISIPSLRDMKNELAGIIRNCLSRMGEKESTTHEISEKALDVLINYDWHGNHTELLSCLEYAMKKADSREITCTHLPSYVMEGNEAITAVSNALDEIEKQHINAILEKCLWNKHEAARELEITKSTLYSKIDKYGLRNKKQGRYTHCRESVIEAV